MPEYKSPGVYVEEVPPLARPIGGVGTSTAGFIGLVMDSVIMPLKPGSTSTRFQLATAGERHLITSWEDFKNSFGDFQKNIGGWSSEQYDGYRRFQHAIFGFFNNGGTRCYVIRIASMTNPTDFTDQLIKFEPIDEIAIVAVPGATTKSQQDAIIDHCEKLKDRVAILDGMQSPASLTVNEIKGGTSANPTKDSGYAALYFPWIIVDDPGTGTQLIQPPSGHLAGVFARVDAERGVYKAPANEIIRGVVDLERRVSRLQQEDLNPLGINIIRAFNGSFKIWGARTLGGDNNLEYKYISTRRYFNFLSESIDQGTQWVVFEPNNIGLWQRISRTISDFLLRQYGDGALFGETPLKAFFVKCDKDINTPEVREAGQVVTEIGVAIVKPAEFVIFRIQQTTGG